MYGIAVRIEADFGAALREAWQRRNEIDGGCEVVVISPETMEVEDDAVSDNQ